MKVLFDSQMFEVQKHGGITRYFSELFKYFNGREDIRYEMPIRDSENEYLRGIKPFSEMDLSSHDFLPGINFRGKQLLRRVYDIFDGNSNLNKSKKALDGQDFDVFHPTYYADYFLKRLKGKPFVLTVYDMIHELYPEFFKDHGKTIRQKKRLICRADKIIAISENTKKDLIRFYGISENKIIVIHLANSLILANEKNPKIPEMPGKYILFVGSRLIYKNFIEFIEAIVPLLKKDKALHIVAAGGGDFSRDEQKLFNDLGVENQVVQHTVSDGVLSYLYQHTICFVFPTLYEGFGLPILEAFACDCPAVLSNSSSLPEVGGEAAEYFDPLDRKNIFEVIERVVSDEGLRQKMVLKGREQLQKFSWEKTAQKTLDIYKSLL